MVVENCKYCSSKHDSFYALIQYGGLVQNIEKIMEPIDTIRVIANTLSDLSKFSQENIDPKIRIKYKTVNKVRQLVSNLIDDNSNDEWFKRLQAEKDAELKLQHQQNELFLEAIKPDILSAIEKHNKGE